MLSGAVQFVNDNFHECTDTTIRWIGAGVFPLAVVVCHKLGFTWVYKFPCNS